MTARAPVSAAWRRTRRVEQRRWQEHRLPGAVDGEGLLGVETSRIRMRTGYYGHVVGRQAPPQLPEVGLDAADLGGEVVGDEKVRGGHRTAALARSQLGSDQRVAVLPQAAEQIRPPQAGRRPHGVGAHDRVGIGEGPGEGGDDTGVRRVPVLPRTMRALRRRYRGSRPGMYQRPSAGHELVVIAGQQPEDVDRGLGAALRGRRWVALGCASRLTGQLVWQSSQPYRRSPSASRYSGGKTPGACTSQARQRRASS